VDERTSDEAGISNLGTVLGMAGLLAVILIVAIVVSLTLPSNSTTSTTTTLAAPREGTNQAVSQLHTTTTTTTTGPTSTPSASEVAACQSDVQAVQTALAAYQATSGSHAAPPVPWSAASYPTNFAPLTNAQPPGPYLKMPPGDNYYVVLFDSSGHVWVEPPGNFTAYAPANDAGNPTVCTRVAH
jgi:cytoskeletal protein RodZ